MANVLASAQAIAVDAMSVVAGNLGLLNFVAVAQVDESEEVLLRPLIMIHGQIFREDSGGSAQHTKTFTNAQKGENFLSTALGKFAMMSRTGRPMTDLTDVFRLPGECIELGGSYVSAYVTLGLRRRECRLFCAFSGGNQDQNQYIAEAGMVAMANYLKAYPK